MLRDVDAVGDSVGDSVSVSAEDHVSVDVRLSVGLSLHVYVGVRDCVLDCVRVEVLDRLFAMDGVTVDVKTPVGVTDLLIGSDAVAEVVNERVMLSDFLSVDDAETAAEDVMVCEVVRVSDKLSVYSSDTVDDRVTESDFSCDSEKVSECCIVGETLGVFDSVPVDVCDRVGVRGGEFVSDGSLESVLL